MKIKAFGIIPVPVTYTDDMPEWKGGFARIFLCFGWVKIRKKYQYDVGLHMHELEHIEQNWRSCFLHPVMYKFSRRYRFWSEVQAYKRQLKCCSEPTPVNKFAHWLANDYNLRISIKEAREAILKES